MPIMERWEQLSGARLLERYGMTETGMVVSNPYKGEMQSPSAVAAIVGSLSSPSNKRCDELHLHKNMGCGTACNAQPRSASVFSQNVLA